MKKLIGYTLVLLSLTTMSFKGTKDEKIIDVKVPSASFTNWLEYEVYTVGEQNISVSITNENGQVFFEEDRTLYGEAYLNLDTSEFPKGVYIINVNCGSCQANVKTQKI